MFLPFDCKRYFEADTLLHSKVCFIISFNATCVRLQLRLRTQFPKPRMTSGKRNIHCYKAVSYIGTQIKYCLLNVDCSCLKAIEISNIIFSLIS